MSDADIIAIGSGHNGLVAAAYCAVAGKKVLVLERNPWFGGGVVTRELTQPGYFHDQHSMSHIFIQGNPLLLNDELGLKSRYGLQYLFPQKPMMSIFEDGRTLSLYRDHGRSVKEIEKFSARDARAFAEMSRQAAEWLPMILGSVYSAPMPTGASHAMMDQSREGRAVWKTMQMSSHDVLTDLFESDEVRMHFARVAGENLVSPDEKATGIGAYVFLGFLEKFGFGVPVGGSGALTAALIACIKDHGGQVIANASVREVTTSGGRANGVILDDGTRYSAKEAIIGAIHPHLLPEMVPDMEPHAASGARATQITEAACITVHAALSEPLRFRAPDADAIMVELMPDSYETLRRCFDELRYGQFMPVPLIGLGSLSQFDPSRVPEGRAILHAWDYVPFERPDGLHWDESKGDHAERMIERMSKFISNMPDVIVQAHVDSPLDMQRTSPSFMRGDLHGIATTSWQSGAHRPTPELGQYQVPGVERLYLVGPFQHPGGGVFGAGRASAQLLLEELGIDFEDVRIS
jgi:phytoene dehydrogenase-like protein